MSWFWTANGIGAKTHLGPENQMGPGLRLVSVQDIEQDRAEISLSL